MQEEVGWSSERWCHLLKDMEHGTAVHLFKLYLLAFRMTFSITKPDTEDIAGRASVP